MNKKYALVSPEEFDKLIKQFMEEFGLPQIRKNLSVYAYNKNKDEFHVNYIDQRCDVRLISAVRKQV